MSIAVLPGADFECSFPFTGHHKRCAGAAAETSSEKLRWSENTLFSGLSIVIHVE
jgi:hypothetical protein